MDLCREYFPTKAYKIAEKKLSLLLLNERNRLDNIAKLLGRECAISSDNLLEQIPQIVDFTKLYHEYFGLYLDAVLPQQPRPIQCRPACGNCCHHYPMSVEPFELITLYMNLRNRNDFIEIIENCQIRSSLFEELYESRLQKVASEDEAEDLALHDYFSQWKPCFFSDSKGDCSIYPLRPVSCRMYFSETDPKYCTPQYLQTKENDSYVIYLPDNIEEAIYGISEHYSELALSESYFGGLLSMNIYEGILG